jgi:hypothetical protein
MTRYDPKHLYIRPLTESEKEKIESATVVTPMAICPDIAQLDSGEMVEVIHAYRTAEGLTLGFNYPDGKYGSANRSEVNLLNPKFHWEYIADRN